MHLTSPRRPGKLIHFALGLVVGVVLTTIIAVILVDNYVQSMRERERDERERAIADLKRRSEDLSAVIDREINKERNEAERIRSEIESRNRRIAELERKRSATKFVAGRVIEVNGQLATINRGSDDGLSPEANLNVFRSLFLRDSVGTLTIVKIEADRSVGLFTPVRPGATIQIGDFVGGENHRK